MFILNKQKQQQLRKRLAYHFPFLRSLKKTNPPTEFQLEPAERIMVQWPGTTRPIVGLVKEKEQASANAYWPKFERFLINNELQYHFIDMSAADWLKEISQTDILVWRPLSSPAQLQESKNKIYAAETILGKTTFPAYRDLWLYEEKINQHYALQHHHLPTPKTFVSHNLEETLAYLERASYPLVWKLNTGSSALGVWKVKNRQQALRQARKVFGKGVTTYWGYEKQKDYIYLQEFIHDSEHDLRVIAAGNDYFGFYRQTPKDDFRASGARIMKKEALPEEALLLARETQQKLDTHYITVDMIKGSNQPGYVIIELSLFTGVISPEQLKVSGVPGRYHYEDGQFVFQEGRFWMQDFMLKATVEKWLKSVSE